MIVGDWYQWLWLILGIVGLVLIVAGAVWITRGDDTNGGLLTAIGMGAFVCALILFVVQGLGGVTVEYTLAPVRAKA